MRSHALPAATAAPRATKEWSRPRGVRYHIALCAGVILSSAFTAHLTTVFGPIHADLMANLPEGLVITGVLALFAWMSTRLQITTAWYLLMATACVAAPLAYLTGGSASPAVLLYSWVLLLTSDLLPPIKVPFMAMYLGILALLPLLYQPTDDRSRIFVGSSLFLVALAAAIGMRISSAARG